MSLQTLNNWDKFWQCKENREKQEKKWQDEFVDYLKSIDNDCAGKRPTRVTWFNFVLTMHDLQIAINNKKINEAEVKDVFTKVNNNDLVTHAR